VSLQNLPAVKALRKPICCDADRFFFRLLIQTGCYCSEIIYTKTFAMHGYIVFSLRYFYAASKDCAQREAVEGDR